MMKVSLMGTGNVAHHLYQTLSAAMEVEIVQVFGRKQDVLGNEHEYSPFDGAIKEADIFILAVSDDSISAVAQKFSSVKGLLVHTSGSVAIDSLPKKVRRGAFYPLQTFSKERKVDLRKTPICIEAETPKDLELLNLLASLISDNVHTVSSEKRAYLHLSAVFVNNFVNHLYQIGETIATDHNLPFTLLHPLISETAKKMDTLSPKDAQTGPSKRGDLSAMKKHLSLLKDHKEYSEIYRLMSQSISTLYEKKL
ncbi:MAG: DUF2520 domain-containing protein [Flavobacteriaceae bacterium]